jgi:hypothetical protein
MKKEIQLSNRGLTLPRGVTFTKTSLLFDADVTPEEWAEVGSYLSAAHRACGLWTGDWVRHGRANYDEQFVHLQIGQLDLPLHGVERFELQAQVAPEHRPESFGGKITPEHLLVVGKRCDDEGERQRWLALAESEGLSPRELQASIRAGKTLKLDIDKRRVDIPSPGAVRRAFDVWRQRIEGWETVWTMKHLDLVADELRPIADFLTRVLMRRDEMKFGPVVEKAERLKAEKLKPEESSEEEEEERWSGQGAKKERFRVAEKDGQLIVKEAPGWKIVARFQGIDLVAQFLKENDQDPAQTPVVTSRWPWKSVAELMAGGVVE